MADKLAPRFEWDVAKEQANRAKHGVAFCRACELLASDADTLEIFDEAHSIDEERFITIGPLEGDVLVVVWTEPDEALIRIIRARWATPRERRLYQRHAARLR